MGDTLDISSLLKALDNDNNENIMDLDLDKIEKMKHNILSELDLTDDKYNSIIKSLSEYKYIDEIPDLDYGHYIRWISLKNPANIKLTNGGILCDIKVNDQVSLLCKNKLNHFFQIKLDECLVFQKLSEQEKIILNVINYLK
jgi:hypothetical protein|tara:strand:+ start:354 stop:779 length:426 start_codon:yes stop_codon:yes gene_type:complete